MIGRRDVLLGAIATGFTRALPGASCHRTRSDFNAPYEHDFNAPYEHDVPCCTLHVVDAYLPHLSSQWRSVGIHFGDGILGGNGPHQPHRVGWRFYPWLEGEPYREPEFLGVKPW